MSVVVKSTAPDGSIFYQLYGHLGPDQLPAPGTPIAADQPIPGAVIGTKDYVRAQGGLTSGPHLHREIISGNVPLNADPNKPFGIYSSDITHKADPDAFDIDRPFFPYQNGEPKPALPSGPSTVPPPSSSAGPTISSRQYTASGLSSAGGRASVVVRNGYSWRGRSDIAWWAERSGTATGPRVFAPTITWQFGTGRCSDAAAAALCARGISKFRANSLSARGAAGTRS